MSDDIRRGGFALPATLLALVVVGALVTGGVYAAMEHDRGSANAEMGEYAFLAAERGLEDVLGTQVRAYFDAIPAGTADTIGPVALTLDDVQAQYRVYVQRLNSRMYKVESEGTVLSGGRYAGSSRRLAEVMRTTYTSYPMDRAVTSHIPMSMVGKAGISGSDTTLYSWSDCPPDQGMQAGVVSKVDLSNIKVVGAAGLDGDPPKVQDPTLDSLDFIQYGDLVLDDLIAVADKTLTLGVYSSIGPVVTGGQCNQGADLNWGDPANPAGVCHYYWPIIYSPGNLKVSSGIGQGILIVAGDLEIAGDMEFHGLVFVYGSLTVVGGGNKVNGSVSILGSSPNDVNIDNTKGAGSTMLQLSSCAIQRAYQYNERLGRPVPLAERKFVDVTGLGLD